MRVITVTRDARPLAVLRACDEAEAVRRARTLARLDDAPAAGRLAAREPTDAEMIGWLIRRDDHLLASSADA